MSEINIPIEPGHQIEVGGRRYEAVAFRRSVDGEHWLAANGEVLSDHISNQPRLILRPLPTRKVPTDQDAAVWPRRKCWVRDDEDRPWSDDGSYFLLGVRQYDFQFLVFNKYGNTAAYRYCEIEAEE